jgi:hypothetical protein
MKTLTPIQSFVNFVKSYEAELFGPLDSFPTNDYLGTAGFGPLPGLHFDNFATIPQGAGPNHQPINNHHHHLNPPLTGHHLNHLNHLNQPDLDYSFLGD